MPESFDKRIFNISTRIVRNKKWLSRLNKSLEMFKLEFVKHAKFGNNESMHQIGKQYSEKSKFIAHVELMILQDQVEQEKFENYLKKSN